MSPQPSHFNFFNFDSDKKAFYDHMIYNYGELVRNYNRLINEHEKLIERHNILGDEKFQLENKTKELENKLYTSLDSEMEKIAEVVSQELWNYVGASLPVEEEAVLVYCPADNNQYFAYYYEGHWYYFIGCSDTDEEIMIGEEITHWKKRPHHPIRPASSSKERDTIND